MMTGTTERRWFCQKVTFSVAVIPFSAAAADAVGITGLNAQGDIFPDTGFQSGLQVQ
ncbi:hypothetical protein ECZU38_00060 [Escherichia coli]|nr:hypothetical protein ECZU38_00060 [Escherichia coli]